MTEGNSPSAEKSQSGLLLSYYGVWECRFTYVTIQNHYQLDPFYIAQIKSETSQGAQAFSEKKKKKKDL